jgi:hypothetical protein
MPDSFDSNWLDSTVCLLVKQAIVLDKNYKEMLIQSDEVDIRIKLWRDAIRICKLEHNSMSFSPIC